MSNQLAAARQRVLAYINRRKIAKGLDIERVHCFDNEFDLLLSDLEALAAHEAAKPAEHAIVAGALFDFLGFLTTSKRRWTFSGSDEAGPAVEALEQWAAKRGLHLDEAIVEGWMEKLRAAPVAVASPLSDEQIEAMPVWKHFVGLMPEHRLEFTRAIEAAHGIKEMKP